MEAAERQRGALRLQVRIKGTRAFVNGYQIRVASFFCPLMKKYIQGKKHREAK